MQLKSRIFLDSPFAEIITAQSFTAENQNTTPHRNLKENGHDYFSSFVLSGVACLDSALISPDPPRKVCMYSDPRASCICGSESLFLPSLMRSSTQYRIVAGAAASRPRGPNVIPRHHRRGVVQLVGSVNSRDSIMLSPSAKTPRFCLRFSCFEQGYSGSLPTNRMPLSIGG